MVGLLIAYLFKRGGKRESSQPSEELTAGNWSNRGKIFQHYQTWWWLARMGHERKSETTGSKNWVPGKLE